MSQVKLISEDLPAVRKVYDAIFNCIQNLPLEIFSNDKFALMVVQALMNLLCSVVRGTGADKEVLLNGIEQIWDGKFGQNDQMLN
ncbi:MAG: hypothetical protein WC516_09165 [Patescibacteria group bacterium]|jgi:hypothetical protein